MKTIFPRNWEINFHASCSEGLTSLLKKEALNHNLEITSYNRGGIFFRPKFWEDLEGFLFSSYYSSRISWVIARWKVKNYEDLYNSALTFPWENWISNGSTFRIESYTKDNLSHSKYTMHKLKDAILDRFNKNNLPIPKIQKSNPDLCFMIRSNQDQASLELSLSPESLTNRGYRQKAGKACLRENIAHALIGFSELEKENSLPIVIIDPFCGQGTILIEAALRWKSPLIHEKKILTSLAYQQLKKLYQYPNGKDKLTLPQPTLPKKIRFIGIDINEAALNLAKLDAKNAGVDKFIQLYKKDIHHIIDLWKDKIIQPYEKVYILTDPPFGKRIGDLETAKALYQELGRIVKELKKNNYTNLNIHLTIITGNPMLLGFLKLKKEKEMNLKNANQNSKIVNYIIYE